MARLINKTGRDITLLTRHVIPAKGELTTTNATIRSPDNWPKISGLRGCGDLEVVFDPDGGKKAPAPVKRAARTSEAPAEDPAKVDLRP
ncbi:hypothetical protein [Paracoccus sp. R12_1]|nr:hypothetical protein [Paracoccus sp. R12_1]